MSYILDALRRADAERDRGSVPGLHAQPVPPVSADAARQRRARPLPWIVVGLSVGLLGPLAWQLAARSDAPADSAVASGTAPPGNDSVSAAPPPALIAAPPPPIAVPPLDAAATPAPPSPIDTMPRAPRRASPPATGAVARAPARATAPASPAPAAPEPRVHALAELPDELRRELPALTIGGSIYSEHPASRFVIINGQTFREKEQVVPGLWLQQIQLKAAVLEYKGYRYSIAY